MKKRLSIRVLSLLLVAALLTGIAAPVTAVSSDSTVTFTQVDNSAVSVSLLERSDEESDTTADYNDTDVVRVSIIMEKDSTIKAGFSTMDIASNTAAISYREGLKNDQINMVSKIEKVLDTDLDVVWNLTLAANLISANVEYGQIEEIEKLPGVKSVVIENQYLPTEVESTTVIPNMATSSAQTGSSLVWEAGYTGAGTRIAVIDTGVDTDHQSLDADAFEYALALLAEQAGMSEEAYVESLDLLDAEQIAAVADDLNVSVDPESAYFSSKIPFGFNYKDADYDITHDNDDQGEHGSHVSGIAAANSWIAAGDGTYVQAMDQVFVQGVAPEAQLLTMKVFGKSGSPYDSDYMAAIEDAIVLGADVVNLSLGSVAPGRGAHSNPVFEAVMDDLTESGVVVSVSAGNSGAWVENAENGGYLYATDVSMDTVGQPGSFTNSLAVASVENDGMVGYYVSVGGEMIVYNENLFNDQQPFTAIAGEYEYIFLDSVGKAEDWAKVADVLPGKIAICSRGETNFVEKASLAVEAGAIAVLIYNNQSGIINLDLTEYYYTAPVAALSQVQGASIRAASTPVTDAEGNVLYLTGKMTVSDTIGLGQFDSAYYTLSSYSSWGVPGSLEMKPEITAPGGSIYSLNGLESSGSSYELMSGTSMASPQVAGMSALMAQYVRESGLAEKTGMSERYLIQSLLMSTAVPLLESEDVYYSILQQGAGLANVYSAITADSYIAMADGSSSGDADGKVKVELFDDPDRTGSYSASFTVYNLEDAEKILNLNADFFMQAVISDGTYNYMDYSTTMLGMEVSWTVDGVQASSMELDGLDFNGDGMVNTDDGQILLDYATGVVTTLTNQDKADVDSDGDIDSHDAYVFLRSLSTTTAVLPAGGSLDITVEFSLTEDAREELERSYPNGTYIQGFLYAETAATTHSIPVLGFYGSWTDPSMFDVGAWTTYATGEDTRMPYIGRTRGNDFKVIYDWDPGYSYSLGGNPVITDAVYMPERNAINSNDSLAGVSFIAIRHADQSRVTVTNETTGDVLLDQLTGAVNMAYYYSALGWQNSGMTLQTNFSLKSASEYDVITMEFALAPEYYVDADGNVDWDSLGDGARLSTSLVIDNTAPELLGVSIDLMNNTMTITASDNQYIAAVGLYNKTGTRCLASTGSKQDIEKGEVAQYTFSLDNINGKKFLLQVFDYAMNTTTYLIEMQIGESTDLPDMMAFDLVSRHWAGFSKDFEYSYKTGTPRVAYSDFVVYAATIAEHYVFASSDEGELYVMPEDDLSDITYITDMEMVLYDMAYNSADGEIYAVNEKGELVSIHKLSGEVTLIGEIGVNTNTLACSPEGVFYCNELGTGKVYSFTLDTMDAPELLMEDPFLTYVDPIAGADMGGTTGNMGMEYDVNTGMICWNSHCEVLVGSYITYAYFYEIDPVTGEFTRYNDFWHEMSGLIIPDRSGVDTSWTSPTDEVMGVKLNKSELSVIRGTSAQLTANVQPWTATDRTVTWTSADESIATVNRNGVVTGIKEGTTTIRATSNLDGTMYAECTVNVEILDVTINGTLLDTEGSPMFYSWNMATGETWTAGNALDVTMTSATYSTQEDVYYIMDNLSGSFRMYKVGADGTTLATADNPNGIPLWDMAYSEVYSGLRGKEQVTSIYYYYLLSPKDPMALDAVGFSLSSLASYLVGVTSMGYEQMTDEDGAVHDTEHLILLDNDGYVWDFWIYDRDDGGMNAMYAISGSDLTCEFPGDDTLDNMYTSLMAGEDGNLYLSTFTGTTNEIYHLSYDADAGQYVAVLIGTMGDDVWPATITSVTMNRADSKNAAASPAPTGTMSSVKITEQELAAASGRASFSVTQAELEIKTNGTGTKDDPYELAVGDNTIASAQSAYGYGKFVAESEGTLTLTIAGSDWRYQFYHYDADGNVVTSTSYSSSNDPNGGVITAELKTGEYILLGITPYVSYTMPEGGVTVNLAFPGESTSEPDPEPGTETGTELVLGENSLVSGIKYTYAVAADGRLEFDFSSLKDSAGSTIYQYTYGKGTRAKIMVNDTYISSLTNTKITVSSGDTVTVELVSVDADTYTVTLNLTALEPAAKLVLGENAIARDTDYSYIAEQDGTLYTSIKELWCDDAYCTEASLSSSVIFKINGSAVYSFNNSYDVKAGDEITVVMGTQFSESASAVFCLSYEGFYQHPAGTRGNPYTLTYAECPTESVEIPAGSAVWYTLSGFGSGYNLIVTGENAYVIASGVQTDAVDGVVTIPAATSVQIGNAGTEAAAFTLSASITEGYADNPKDLAEGDNTATLEKSGNYYYDFVAMQGGTVTVTVSGDNWRFWFSHIGTDGTAIVDAEDHRQARGDEATVTLDIKAGESILIKLGTMTSSWTAPGGDITVNFHFEASEGGTEECVHTNTEIRDQKDATCTQDGYTGDTWCIDCGELISSGETITALGHDYQDGVCANCGEPDPDASTETDNTLALGKNTLESGVAYTYTVPADGRMEFTVNSVKNSAGSKLYSWTNGSNVQILVDGQPLSKSSKRFNVTAGQVITVQVAPVDEDTYTVELTLTELAIAQTLVLGENNIAQDLEHLYIAEQDGTLYISIVELLYNGEQSTASDLGSSILYKVNGSSVSSFDKSCTVKAGDEVTIELLDYSWDGSGTVSAIVNLSYEGFYQHPAGSIANPVELLYADCPTKTIEIAAGSSVWYELESYYDSSAWSTVYPFEDKYLVVTGEDAYVIVGGTRYDAVDGVVKVLMDDTTLIQIGNDGTEAAVFDLAVEIPEGHQDNPKDLVEGDNKVTLASYSSYYYDFLATEDGTATVTVSGENWKFNFAHYDADGNKVSGKDYYAKNDDTNTVTLEMKAGEKIIVMVGTSKGYSQPGGDITVNFHFEPTGIEECTHTNTEVRDAKAATCTEEGYTGDTWCIDCETMIAEGSVIPAAGHDYQDGVCANCGEADPDAVPDNTVAVEVTNDVLATNGVVEVSWDPAKLTLTGIVIHADYTSVLEADGSVTFGYVSLRGIPAGEPVATLTFEAVDPADAIVTIVHKQVNNGSNGECEHVWSDWTENAQGQMERCCLSCGRIQVNPFVDVSVDSYYIDAVLWAVENGITTGTTEITFSPEEDCIRAQAVTFLWRAAGSPEPVGGDNPFVDVNEGDYYYKAVLWAVENGITNGIDATHFAPMDTCTRGQVVTFLWRAEGSPVVSAENPFVDVEEGVYYEQAILWAVANGITNGMDSTHFAPRLVCNRDQVVTFLYRTYA